MWPAGVEPAAPRVSGGRSTGLSYGHVCTSRGGRGWNRTSGLLFVRQALWPAELLARGGTGGQGWSRTSGLFRIREALFLLSYRPKWLAPTSRKDDPGRLRARHAQATMLMARLQSDKGQTYVEYALILAVLVALLAATATPLRTAIENAVTQVSLAL